MGVEGKQKLVKTITSIQISRCLLSNNFESLTERKLAAIAYVMQLAS